MLAGIVAPSILSYAGLIPQAPEEVIWFRTGVIPPAGTYDKYWADPYTLFFLEVIAFQFAELRRWQDYRKPGSMGKQYFLGLESVLGGSGDPAYPGESTSTSSMITAPPLSLRLSLGSGVGVQLGPKSCTLFKFKFKFGSDRW